MAAREQTYDVFIAHDPADSALAERIARAFRAIGLSALVGGDQLGTGRKWEIQLRQAIAESRAFLVIVSPSGPTSWMLFEIGAAQAWEKPIIGIVTDPTNTQIPGALRGVRWYSATNIEDVLKAVQSAKQEMSEDDRAILASLYADLGVPIDRMTDDPIYLQKAVKKFKSKTGKVVPGEYLLAELFRMRKQGKLSRARSGSR